MAIHGKYNMHLPHPPLRSVGDISTYRARTADTARCIVSPPLLLSNPSGTAGGSTCIRFFASGYIPQPLPRIPSRNNLSETAVRGSISIALFSWKWGPEVRGTYVLRAVQRAPRCAAPPFFSASHRMRAPRTTASVRRTSLDQSGRRQSVPASVDTNPHRGLCAPGR